MVRIHLGGFSKLHSSLIINVFQMQNDLQSLRSIWMDLLYPGINGCRGMAS